MGSSDSQAGGGREAAARLHSWGVWSAQLHWQPAPRAREIVARLEALGAGAIWIGEATSKEALSHATLLLGAGRRIAVATGIANIWGRDPLTMSNGGRTIEEAFPGRFVLGLGVSHPGLVELRGRRYDRPLSQMRAYLEAMDRAPYAGVPAEPPPRVLAALGPRMISLAREMAAGVHSYFVPVEHTVRAREILGPEPLLAPEQAAVLETDRSVARDVARAYMATYTALPNYVNNLRRFGWSDRDLAGGGSDRLTEALVAWGDTEAIVRRVREHHEAGADHVAVRVLTSDPADLPLERVSDLAAALT